MASGCQRKSLKAGETTIARSLINSSQSLRNKTLISAGLVVVYKIDRFYPSSKTCECGYINKELKLSDRMWVCPECGETHNRNVLAANNILRRGIYELESDSKTSKRTAKRLSRLHPRIPRL